jgi:hypothetical protein
VEEDATYTKRVVRAGASAKALLHAMAEKPREPPRRRAAPSESGVTLAKRSTLFKRQASVSASVVCAGQSSKR